MKRFVKTMLPVAMTVTVTAGNVSGVYAQSGVSIRTNIIEHTESDDDFSGSDTFDVDSEAKLQNQIAVTLPGKINDSNDETGDVTAPGNGIAVTLPGNIYDETEDVNTPGIAVTLPGNIYDSNDETGNNKENVVSGGGTSYIGNITSSSAIRLFKAGEVVTIEAVDGIIDGEKYADVAEYEYNGETAKLVLTRTDVVYKLTGDFGDTSIKTSNNNIVLSNFTITVDSYNGSPFIITEGTTTITVEGLSNVINMNKLYSNAPAILIEHGNLVLNGTGKLVINSTRAGIDAEGSYYRGSVTINDVALEINAEGNCIGGYGKITIGGNANVKANMKEQGDLDVAIGSIFESQGFWIKWDGIEIKDNANVDITTNGGVGIGGGLYGMRSMQLEDYSENYGDIVISTKGKVKVLSDGTEHVNNKTALIGSSGYCNIGDIIISGSNVEVEQRVDESQMTNEFAIYAASYGAGIGSGAVGYVKNIIIENGSNVDVSVFSRGAAIGSGGGNHSGPWSEVGDITISRSTVKAVNNYDNPTIDNDAFRGAGIGSGGYGTVGDITITDGKVHAEGAFGSPGIGVGFSKEFYKFSYTEYNKKLYANIVGDITISGGDVTATGGDGAAGIGTGINMNLFEPAMVYEIGDINILNGAVVTAKSGKTGKFDDGNGFIMGDIIVSGNAIGFGGLVIDGSEHKDEQIEEYLRNYLQSTKLGSINLYDGVSVKAYAMNDYAIALEEMGIVDNRANVINAYMAEALNKDMDTNITATPINGEYGKDYTETDLNDKDSIELTLPAGYTAFAYTGEENSYMNSLENGSKVLVVSDTERNAENFILGLSEIQTYQKLNNEVLVHVEDFERVEVTIDTVYDTDTVITGKSNDDAPITVVLVDKDGNVVATIENVVVDENGVWTVNLDDVDGVDSLNGIDVINAYQVGEGDNTPDRIAKEVNQLTIPEINSVYTDSTELSGTGHPNSTIDVIYVTETGEEIVIATGVVVDENGNWSVADITNVELAEGNTIKVVQTFDGRELEAETIVLKEDVIDNGNGGGDITDGGDGNGNGGGDITDGGDGNGNGGGDITDGGNGNGNGGGDITDGGDGNGNGGGNTTDSGDDDDSDDELVVIEGEDVPLGIGSDDEDEDILYAIDGEDVPLGIGSDNEDEDIIYEIDGEDVPLGIGSDSEEEVDNINDLGIKANPKTGEKSTYPLAALVSFMSGMLLFKRKNYKGKSSK